MKEKYAFYVFNIKHFTFGTLYLHFLSFALLFLVNWHFHHFLSVQVICIVGSLSHTLSVSFHSFSASFFSFIQIIRCAITNVNSFIAFFRFRFRLLTLIMRFELCQFMVTDCTFRRNWKTREKNLLCKSKNRENLQTNERRKWQNKMYVCVFCVLLVRAKKIKTEGIKRTKQYVVHWPTFIMCIKHSKNYFRNACRTERVCAPPFHRLHRNAKYQRLTLGL